MIYLLLAACIILSGIIALCLVSVNKSDGTQQWECHKEQGKITWKKKKNMTQQSEIITSNDELKQLVKDGLFFNFCIAFALNKGFRNALKEKKEVTFLVGYYEVVFDSSKMCFTLTHKVYFARIICAYYNEVLFTGDNENEVISELYSELEKELLKSTLS